MKQGSKGPREMVGWTQKLVISKLGEFLLLTHFTGSVRIYVWIGTQVYVLDEWVRNNWKDIERQKSGIVESSREMTRLSKKDIL